MRRALVCLAVSCAAVLGLSAPAYAATPCDTAVAATATAQANFNNALAVAIARAQQIGFTAAQITTAQNMLSAGAPLSDAQKAQLMGFYAQHFASVNVATDLPKVTAVINTKLALAAAIAAQNIACPAPAPAAAVPAPATVAPAPVVAAPAPVVVPAPLGTMLMPVGAPATGDGSMSAFVR